VSGVLVVLSSLTACGGTEQPPDHPAVEPGSTPPKSPKLQGVQLRNNCYCFRKEGDRGRFRVWAKSDKAGQRVSILIFPRAQIDSRTPKPSSAVLKEDFDKVDFELAPLGDSTTFRVQLRPSDGGGGESIDTQCEASQCG
jgi:hypothetical protein